MTTREPILMRCEGSGNPPAGGSRYLYLSMCAMCGQNVPHENGLIVKHDRDDILTRIERGDFA